MSGNNERASERLRRPTRKGSRRLRQGPIAAARGAGRTKATYLGAQLRRLTAKRGKTKAVLAVPHSLLVIAYHVLTRRGRTVTGGTHFRERDCTAVERRAVRGLARFGYRIGLVSQGAA